MEVLICPRDITQRRNGGCRANVSYENPHTFLERHTDILPYRSIVDMRSMPGSGRL